MIRGGSVVELEVEVGILVDVVGGGIVVGVGLVVDSVSNRNIVIIIHVVYRISLLQLYIIRRGENTILTCINTNIHMRNMYRIY